MQTLNQQQTRPDPPFAPPRAFLSPTALQVYALSQTAAVNGDPFAGSLFWLLTPDGVEDWDSYSIYIHKDAEILRMVTRQAKFMSAVDDDPQKAATFSINATVVPGGNATVTATFNASRAVAAVPPPAAAAQQPQQPPRAQGQPAAADASTASATSAGGAPAAGAGGGGPGTGAVLASLVAKYAGPPTGQPPRSGSSSASPSPSPAPAQKQAQQGGRRMLLAGDLPAADVQPSPSSPPPGAATGAPPQKQGAAHAHRPPQPPSPSPGPPPPPPPSEPCPLDSDPPAPPPPAPWWSAEAAVARAQAALSGNWRFRRDENETAAEPADTLEFPAEHGGGEQPSQGTAAGAAGGVKGASLGSESALPAGMAAGAETAGAFVPSGLGLGSVATPQQQRVVQRAPEPPAAPVGEEAEVPPSPPPIR